MLLLNHGPHCSITALLNVRKKCPIVSCSVSLSLGQRTVDCWLLFHPRFHSLFLVYVLYAQSLITSILCSCSPILSHSIHISIRAIIPSHSIQISIRAIIPSHSIQISIRAIIPWHSIQISIRAIIPWHSIRAIIPSQSRSS